MSASTRASRGPKRSLPHLPLFSADGECPLASQPSSCHTRGTDCGGRAPKARVHQIRKRGISIISRLPMFAARPPGVHVPLDIHPSGAAGAKKRLPATLLCRRPPGRRERRRRHRLPPASPPVTGTRSKEHSSHALADPRVSATHRRPLIRSSSHARGPVLSGPSSPSSRLSSLRAPRRRRCDSCLPAARGRPSHARRRRPGPGRG